MAFIAFCSFNQSQCENNLFRVKIMSSNRKHTYTLVAASTLVLGSVCGAAIANEHQLSWHSQLATSVKQHNQTNNAKSLDSVNNNKITLFSDTVYHVNFAQLASKLNGVDAGQLQSNADSATILLTLPLPSGELVQFNLVASSVMAPELAEKYPQFKTFYGEQVGEPLNSGRFDLTSNGFHAMFKYQNETIFIEPAFKGTTDYYQSYARKTALKDENRIRSKLQAPKINTALPSLPKVQRTANDLNERNANTSTMNKATSTIRTYKFAVSAVGEYTQFHGGTKESALAELVTLTNRLNDVYQRDMSIKLELVADNDKIIYTDAATDPFNNDDNDGELNTAVIDAAIGANNYDIGHVVVTSGGGLAVLGGACFTNYKGDGLTGSSQPVNDAFYIDYVAHEVGHQFGANHTFNASSGGCNGNRTSSAAYEPGSASTIMGYAGLCGSENLQNNSDPFFSAHSIDQITTFVAQPILNTCGTDGSQNNNVPVPNAGNDYTIPANTPFTLSGSASDADNDTLTYSWEQFDLGAASSSAAEMIDDGNRPIFRVFNPTNEAVRIFPQLASILSGNLVTGEAYPTTNRSLNFRLLARDNNGGVGSDATVITVQDTGQAFAVTSPLSTANWSAQQQTVTWNVAGTNATPISCSQVDIMLSEDGGLNFSATLAQGVTNDGSHQVTVPNVSSTQTRVKVACSDNIFFAINEGNFTTNVSVGPTITAQSDITVSENGNITLTPSMFTASDGSLDAINVQAGDNYTFTGTTVTPTSGFFGSLTVGIVPVKDNVSGSVYLATITVQELETPVISGQQTISVEQDNDLTLTASMFTFSGIAAQSINVLAGENYTVSGTTITPSTGFTGELSVGIQAVANGKTSETFQATISVTETPVTPVPPNPTPTPEPESSSSGGSFSWLVLFGLGLGLITIIRRANSNKGDHV